MLLEAGENEARNSEQRFCCFLLFWSQFKEKMRIIEKPYYVRKTQKLEFFLQGALVKKLS